MTRSLDALYPWQKKDAPQAALHMRVMMYKDAPSDLS